VSANARPLAAILSHELGANLIYLNVIKKEVGCPALSANARSVPAIWSCRSGATL
jgi:hypothetical protein